MSQESGRAFGRCIVLRLCRHVGKCVSSRAYLEASFVWPCNKKDALDKTPRRDSILIQLSRSRS